MKKTNSDLQWIIFILLLLVVETTWLLADLQWINLPFFTKNAPTNSGSIEAGYVVKAKSELKRRGANSLIWESTKENDVLFYNDSILTLSQSSAKLYLNDKTELLLSENTLVTLEEPDNKSTSEIRLRFSKGDLKTRNPYGLTRVHGDDWVVNLEKGSEVALRKDNDVFEFEVISGQATLQTGKVTQQLTESQISKLGSDQKVSTVEKSKALLWDEKKNVRVYIFGESTEVPLSWTGNALELLITKVGESEVAQTLTADQHRFQLPLKLGNYNLRLRDGQGVSDALAVEVWRSPKIYLKKPLPRDRLQVGEQNEFVWTIEKGVKQYNLKFSDAKDFSESDNFKALQFEREKDLTWKVEGKDDEGYRIPAFYQNEIYIREKPLQAPKLKAPNIRMPIEEKPKDGAAFDLKWYWLFKKLLLNEARGSKLKSEVVFEWEAVDGADHYVIEVSSDASFRDPEVIAKVKNTKYVWKNYVKGNYFWRVASGSSKGRMGLFSEAIELKPEDIHQVVVEVVRPVEKKENKSVPTPELFPEPIPLVLVDPPTPQRFRPSLAGWGFAWAPSYKISSIKGHQNEKIKLAGIVPTGFQIEFKTPAFANYNYSARLWQGSQKWKPQSETEMPFQSQIEIEDTWIFLDAGHYLSSFRFGLAANQSFAAERITNEIISVRKVWLSGVRAAWSLDEDLSQKKVFGFSVVLAEGVKQFSFDFQYKRYISDEESKTRFYCGLSGNASFSSGDQISGSQNNLILLLGLDRF